MDNDSGHPWQFFAIMGFMLALMAAIPAAIAWLTGDCPFWQPFGAIYGGLWILFILACGIATYPGEEFVIFMGLVFGSMISFVTGPLAYLIVYAFWGPVAAKIVTAIVVLITLGWAVSFINSNKPSDRQTRIQNAAQVRNNWLAASTMFYLGRRLFK